MNKCNSARLTPARQVNYKEERLVFEVQLDSHKEPTRNMKVGASGDSLKGCVSA